MQAKPAKLRSIKMQFDSPEKSYNLLLKGYAAFCRPVRVLRPEAAECGAGHDVIS
jgi:hypothetical protein